MTMLKPLTDETFQKEVRESELPVVLVFTGSWCQPCKRMKPALEQLAEQMDGDIKFLEVDIEQNEALASEFAIRSVPSMALFSDGMIRDVITGSQSKLEVRQWITENV